MIADGLRRAGWSVGWFKFMNAQDGTCLWSADATRGDGHRLVVQAEDLTIAFLELESECRGIAGTNAPRG